MNLNWLELLDRVDWGLILLCLLGIVCIAIFVWVGIDLHNLNKWRHQ